MEKRATHQSQQAPSLGQRIRRERERHHWSQEELATTLGDVGVSSIIRWEHDKAVPRPYYRDLLCRAFNLSHEALFGATAEDIVVTPADTTTLPVGTLTLLFADIEGSTRLLHQLGNGYADLLSAYRSLLRATVQQCNGSEVDTQGDAFFAVFPRATDAVSAALAAQRTLAMHPWPTGVSVRVRMGLHTGEPQRAAEGYIGLDVHQAARIMSAGHGGQVLLSQTTHQLVARSLPERVGLQDLGTHRLKDFHHPAHLYQLVSADLPASFPQLKTQDTHPNYLPVQPTTLVGRDTEVTALKQLLQREDVRLLTLTGPGGIGKTRLALQVATNLLNDFPDGVSFVPLAPVRDPQFVIPTIAKVLDIQESAELPLAEQLTSALTGKHLLLLLDNFEQVVSAAPLLSALLEACPSLKMLVTSREVLRVRGEREFVVPPLALPDLQHLPTTEALSAVASIELFVQRAQAVTPDFHLTPANAQVIAQICTRLDGLPLALELATARLKLLSPQALLARLEHRLQVLTRGSREVAERQQTLYNTLQWSYELLSHEEQRLFRSLAVFSAGWILPAAQAICAVDSKAALDVEDGLSSLIDKSLVRQSVQADGELRFTLLETIREFALDCLEKHGEADSTRWAHAAYYLALAEEAEPHLRGAQQVQWWKQLEREQENLRAALSWLIGQQPGELALRMSGALWSFWDIHGYWSEGWRWLEAALELPQAQGRTARRAKALYGAAEFAEYLGHPLAHSLYEESVAIYRELGDKHGLARSLSSLGLIISRQNEAEAGRMLLEESVALAREVGDPWVLAWVLNNIGNFMSSHRDLKSARVYLEESAMLYPELNDKHMLSFSLHLLSEVAMSEGNVTQSAQLAQESLVLARELDNRPIIFLALYSLALARSFQGDVEQAVALLEECLTLAREQGNKGQIGGALLGLGSIVLYQGDLLRAEACAQESRSLFRGLRFKGATAVALSLLGEIRLRQGDLTQARAMCTEGVLLASEGVSHYHMGNTLISLAKVAAAEGQSAQATRLFGAAEPWINPSTELDPFERADYERAVESVRAQLGEEAFKAAWAAGRAMTPEHILALQQ